MSDNVGNNNDSKPKKLGGCTGKGFMPGKSGNPSGRPKGLLSGELWRQLKAQNGVKLEQSVAGIIRSMVEGNPKAFAVVRDSVDGRPVTPVEVTGSLELFADTLAKARKRAGK